jgi:hypothetical protein
MFPVRYELIRVSFTRKRNVVFKGLIGLKMVRGQISRTG